MVARTHSAPSSSFGMNSAPIRGISSSDSASSTAEASVVAPGTRETDIQALDVDRLDGFEGGVAPLAHALAHEPRAQHRQQRQRDDQRADEREHHRVGHRLEQLAGRPRQHVDRQEAGHDHRDGIDQRAVHFRRGILDDLHDIAAVPARAPPAGGRCSPPSRPRHPPGCRNPPRRSTAGWPRRSADPGR